MADHEDAEFVISQVKLAATYKAAGDVRQAISLLEQTLAYSERALGDDHLVTGLVRSNLAAAFQAAGKPQRAIPLLEQAVADTERALGHPGVPQQPGRRLSRHWRGAAGHPVV